VGTSGLSYTGGAGVQGQSYSGPGVYGYSYRGDAGYFVGNLHVSGTVNKAAVQFQIDHPLDPKNKYLYHSGVESPSRMNIYDGVATLNKRGETEVVLPKWFQALNTDFRYQLTAIGAPGPNLYIAHEIRSNRFKIAGGSPGSKVAWQVTGVRQDAWAKAHPAPVEEKKNAKDRGRYLHPDAFSQPEGKRISVAPSPRPIKQLEKELAEIRRAHKKRSPLPTPPDSEIPLR
jgi:hypothetical protein